MDARQGDGLVSFADLNSPSLSSIARNGPGSSQRYSMADPQWVAVCCYKSRDITWSRCAGCRPEYGCSGFRSSAELVHFNELIPPSMLGEPLPLNLWPNLWRAIEPNPERSGATENTPVRLLVAALGLPCGKSVNPDP
jgi:hypothetical protein